MGSWKRAEKVALFAMRSHGSLVHPHHGVTLENTVNLQGFGDVTPFLLTTLSYSKLLFGMVDSWSPLGPDLENTLKRG